MAVGLRALVGKSDGKCGATSPAQVLYISFKLSSRGSEEVESARSTGSPLLFLPAKSSLGPFRVPSLLAAMTTLLVSSPRHRPGRKLGRFHTRLLSQRADSGGGE